MAKTQAPMPKLHIQSNDPDQMGFDRWSGGIGTIVESYFAPSMFSRETGKHALFHHLIIREEDETEHTQRYLRGFFGNTDKEGKKSIGRNTYPVREDGTIAGPLDKSFEELLEEYAELAKGKDENNSIPSIPEEEQPLYRGVFAGTMDAGIKGQNNDDKQLMSKIKELTRTDPADPDTSLFKGDERSDAICGHKFQWDLIAQQYPFKSKDGEKKSDFEVLIPTHYFGVDEDWEAEHKANGKTKKETATLSKATEESETEPEDETEPNPLEGEVEEKIRSFLVKNKGKQLVKKDLTTHVANAFPPEKRKEVLSIAGDNSWITDNINRPWTYADGKFTA